MLIMPEIRTKTEIKTELKKLIKKADYLPNSEIKSWLLIIEYLSVDELRDTYKHFEKTEKEREEYKLKLIFKANLGDQYTEKTNDISKKFKKKAMGKEEKFLRETTENPEEVLKKLKKA
jgi:hypothetical protein